eukprot:g16182.t1
MCHVGQGKKCRKHLSPFTKQIRVEDEAEETEEEADPDLSFHQVFRAARRFVLGDFDGSENQCGCYRVSLFLNTSSRNLQKYRQAHPSLIASEKEVFFSNTRNSIKAEARGSWRTIVVDDIVPDSDGPRACRPKGAVWPSIIEKAFAKACGSYERTNLLTLPTHW